MTPTIRPLALALLTLATLVAPPALAGEDGWHSSLKAGLKAAQQSGKLVLYVTAWKPGT